MKLIKLITIIIIFGISKSYADNLKEFDQWKSNFKEIALAKNISEATFDKVMSNVKFLPKVIEYDRFQPEFYEDTKTYIEKRTSKQKLIDGITFYNKFDKLIDKVEIEFDIGTKQYIIKRGIKKNFFTIYQDY